MTRLPQLLTISALLCFSGLPGGAQSAKTATPSADTLQRIAKIESCLPPPVIVAGDAVPCSTLAQQMTELHVPGVSVAVVHNGKIEWARGYGVQELGGKPVTEETRFQAGSISKPVAAMAALHLVQEGRLSLDADVNTELTSWKVPASAAAPGATVTLRELLTHTAGFTVHGFPGYAKDAPVPTLVQVLNGEKPANTDPIRLESVPGSKWNYSGGGYTVMQEMVVDVAKEPFPHLLHDTVLVPTGMTHSGYDQPLPEQFQASAATPYEVDEKAVQGGAHTYPEMAAAGLWTTPSDLARYVIEVQESLQDKANHVLSRELTQQMLTPGKGDWGLGLQIGGSAANPYFSHGGVNAGFESLFVAYEHGGVGAVVMTNAQGGSRLADELMRSIAVAYGWPDYQPVTRTAIKADPAVLSRLVGVYQLAPNFTLTFTLDGNQLYVQGTGQTKLETFPESPTKVFLKIVDAEGEFFADDKGQVQYLVWHQNGHDTKGMKQ